MSALSGVEHSIHQEYVAQDLESRRKKAVGQACEAKPHLQFEVAADGNRDTVWLIEALSKETESMRGWPAYVLGPFSDPST